MEIEFKVKMKIKELDYCESDLNEAIKDGIENIGNHTLERLEIIKIK